MSGHSKWSSIKHKKGAADAKRGKVFSRIGKEITLAAREGGGDPDLNPLLRSAMESAKNANMPKKNVERAIKKGTGDLEGGALEKMSYEGYAVEGVAVIVSCLSDNRNRTAAEVRSIFTKHNASLAANGAVAYMFERKAMFVVDGEHADEDELLELILENDLDVEEIDVSSGTAEILAAPEAFPNVLQVLEEAEIPIEKSTLPMVPDNTVPVTDSGSARQVLHLIEALEDNEDVQEVYSNFDISDELLEEIADED